MHSKTLALFGAGKIGRSFIAQVFARNGYKVVFIDLNTRLIEAINTEKHYTVVTLESDGSRSEFRVEGISAVDARDSEGCLALLLQVSIVATSVGAGVIPALCGLFVEASKKRQEQGIPPFNLIIAENMPNAESLVQSELDKKGLPRSAHPGIIAASIGKTSPEVPSELSAKDPLLVYADSYNTLTLSAKGWRGSPPPLPRNSMRRIHSGLHS